jgi:hypothetical protein
LPET